MYAIVRQPGWHWCGKTRGGGWRISRPLTASPSVKHFIHFLRTILNLGHCYIFDAGLRRILIHEGLILVQFSRPTCPGLNYNHRCSSSPPKWHQGSAWACVRHLYRCEQRWQRKSLVKGMDEGTRRRWNIFLDSLLFSSFLIERPIHARLKLRVPFTANTSSIYCSKRHSYLNYNLEIRKWKPLRPNLALKPKIAFIVWYDTRDSD